MRARIDAHVARRPGSWSTVEADGSLAEAVSGAQDCVLVDGLGPWIATRIHRGGGFGDPSRLPAIAQEIADDLDRTTATLTTAAHAIVVAEQAGEGVLPPDAASRAWLDLLGDATQRLAAHADRVDLIVAGRVVPVAGSAPGPADAALRRHGDRDVRPGDADHAVNVVAGGPPRWLQAALNGALAEVGRYPDERPAIAAIAALHGRASGEIVPTNGAAEALWLLGPALRPTLAACVHPGFTEAEAGLRAHSVPTVRVQRDPDRGFALEPDRVPDAADLVVVGNPASPSGTLDPATAVLALRRPGRVVVVDEAFMDLVPGEPGTLARRALPDVIVVRSLTKVLGIPGLRAGYAIAHAEIAERLRAVRPPWSANTLALTALAAAAAAPSELSAIARRAADQRQDLHARLAAIDGVRIWPGAANYVLIAVDDGEALVAALRAQGIAVRPAASFPGLDARHVRVTARDPGANARLADAVAGALA
ncbi:aminotransferase class I/II-fold pyridoxal phosphate-dependent enzyme [Baekduia soli]|uniref:Aminotransferase n=2 Tax=Baekduia soli TaxID=496014 RepID=A0A5B8UC78_9ACTN|nr:aminotransferase class I/II-fold pyridoxal phosphate-dependent enzyme [Baekduia soli]